MNQLRFDGQVAVVTGAGRGLGRAYAQLLAERGASVVVNDLGGSIEGEGSDDGPAARVVDEIVTSGGSALANTDDVSTVAGGDALVAAAVDTYGRIDIVVNNAGIMRWIGMPDLTADVLDAHLDVHVNGAFNTARAAWPHMAAAGYGRIVNTTSTGMLGLWNNTSYAAAKAGVVGLTRSLALAGRRAGIAVNAIAPAAMTRMAGEADGAPPMPPASVAPMVAVLAHESCPVSGEVLSAGAGRFARLFVAATPGWVADDTPTAEDLVTHWDEVVDESGYSVPGSLHEWSATFLAHLAPE